MLVWTLKNLMANFENRWGFGECGVPLHCHRFQVNFDLGVMIPPFEGVHRRTSLMSSSLLPKEYCECLIWMVFEMPGEWLYGRCFVGCCFLDLFDIARYFLVRLP